MGYVAPATAFRVAPLLLLTLSNPSERANIGIFAHPTPFKRTLEHSSPPLKEVDAILERSGMPVKGFNAILECSGMPVKGFDAILERSGMPVKGFTAILERSGTPVKGFDAILERSGTPVKGFDAILERSGTLVKGFTAIIERSGLPLNRSGGPSDSLFASAREKTGLTVKLLTPPAHNREESGDIFPLPLQYECDIKIAGMTASC